MKMKMMIIFCHFPSSEAPVEWNLQGKAKVLGGGGGTCPSATLSTTNPTWTDPRHRTRASAVGGSLLTAWAMARPRLILYTYGELNPNSSAWPSSDQSAKANKQNCTFSRLSASNAFKISLGEILNLLVSVLSHTILWFFRPLNHGVCCMCYLF
jgi:hypothetical protein